MLSIDNMNTIPNLEAAGLTATQIVTEALGRLSEDDTYIHLRYIY